MTERILSLNPTTLESYEHLYLSQWAEHVLPALGIDTNEMATVLTNQEYEKLLTFLGTRIFDRGHYSEKERYFSKAHQQPDIYSPLPVLSSRVLPLLEEYYEPRSFYDVNNMYGANQISYQQGDELLRHVTHEIMNRSNISSSLLVRWGGDEFILMQQKDTYCDPIDTKLLGRRSFAYGYEHVIQPIGITLHDIDDIPQRTYYTDGTVEERIHRLQQLYPEIGYIATELHNAQCFEQLITLLEYCMYDPLLQNELEDMYGCVPEGIRMFQDASDMIEWIGVEPHDFTMMLVTFPGVLKQINELGGNYTDGDRFITYCFGHIMNSWQAVCDSCDDEVAMLRKGSDFYMYIDEAQYRKSDAFKAVLNECFPKEYEGVPLFLVAAQSHKSIVKCAEKTSSSEHVLSTEITAHMKLLDQYAQTELFELLLKAYCNGTKAQKEYVTCYFNDKKRGLARRNKLEIYMSNLQGEDVVYDATQLQNFLKIPIGG